jgi:hypothetical protein
MFEPIEEEILFNHYYKINYNSPLQLHCLFKSDLKAVSQGCKAAAEMEIDVKLSL